MIENAFRGAKGSHIVALKARAGGMGAYGGGRGPAAPPERKAMRGMHRATTPLHVDGGSPAGWVAGGREGHTWSIRGSKCPDVSQSASFASP